jgi:DNA polymerase II small subunit
MRDEVLDALANEGILLEPDAAEFVLAQADPVRFTRSALALMKQQPLVLTLDDLRSAESNLPYRPAPPENGKAHLASNHGGVKVLKDITGNSTCEGNIIDFARYFNDRFETIKKMLVKRRELVGHLPVPRALKGEREVRLIAMVNDVRNTKNGHKMLEVEDAEGKCLALIMKESPFINDSIVLDEVIGIIGKNSRKGDMVVVDEIIRPDVPLRGGMAPSDSTAQVAFVSDIHVGSNTFLRPQWDRMTEWLSTNAAKENLGYLIIPGDCVDGIGIFPDQEEELDIEDIFEQYEALADLLKGIPDGIQIVMQPGNHDAVRPAEPQPAFPDQIARLFDSSVMLVGNPCYLEIEGRSILSYHGRSMDDLVSCIQGVSYDTPLEGMKEMLKRRHMAPVYGGKTPIAPEKKDYLVIDPIPDIFVTGHVHGVGISEYRGVRLINASTWQDQTPFQRMHNYHPNPAKMPMLHLGTGKCVIKDFA